MSQELFDLEERIFASPIMVVDDTEINRIFLDKMLRSRGFSNVNAVASAEEAIAQMDSFQPDIILLDILMPGGMDGFECCETLRCIPKYRDLPILIQTSITEPELRVKAFSKGATDFVSKPVNADELCARVKVHLEKRHSLKVLQLYQNRIRAELESARQLQLGILPNEQEIKENEDTRGLSIAACFKPSSEIGGDFWGMQSLGAQQTALWLVDFSGHGVAAAINAFRLHAYLQEKSILATRPGEYLSLLNDKLRSLLPPGHFATMFYGVIDIQSSQLHYACSCIPHPIILRRATGKAEMINGSGNPLGVGMHLYSTQSVPFVSGDLLLLYSDAYTETPNAKGEYITEEQIMRLLEQNATMDPVALKGLLENYLMKHAQAPLRDDLTLVLCTRSAQ